MKMDGFAKMGSPAFAMQPGETMYVAKNEFKDFLGQMHQGGPIKQSGGYELLAGEMVMDNEAAEIIRSSVSIFGQILNQQAMDRSGMEGSGGANSATIIDNSSQYQFRMNLNY